MNLEIRKVITQHEFHCLLSEAYGNLDIEQLEDKSPLTFEDIENIVKFILYNEFDIEVVKGIKE